MRHTWAKKLFERTQKCLYFSREVCGAYNSLMSLPIRKKQLENRRGQAGVHSSRLTWGQCYINILNKIVICCTVSFIVLPSWLLAGSILYFASEKVCLFSLPSLTCCEDRTIQAWGEDDTAYGWILLKLIKCCLELLPELCVQGVDRLSCQSYCCKAVAGLNFEKGHVFFCCLYHSSSWRFSANPQLMPRDRWLRRAHISHWAFVRTRQMNRPSNLT